MDDFRPLEKAQEFFDNGPMAFATLIAGAAGLTGEAVLAVHGMAASAPVQGSMVASAALAGAFAFASRKTPSGNVVKQFRKAAGGYAVGVALGLGGLGSTHVYDALANECGSGSKTSFGTENRSGGEQHTSRLTRFISSL